MIKRDFSSTVNRMTNKEIIKQRLWTAVSLTTLRAPTHARERTQVALKRDYEMSAASQHQANPRAKRGPRKVDRMLWSTAVEVVFDE